MTALPAGWQMCTLGDVARWGSGGTPKAGTSRYYGGPIPWAVIGDLTDGPVSRTSGTLTADGLRESSAKLVPPGAVLVAMYGSIGKLGLAATEMATNQAIAFAVPHEGVVEAKFLFLYLMAQREDLTRAGKGATQQNIGQGTLKAWPLPLPPIDEQRRIVDVVEDHLSRLDAGMAGVSGVPSRLDVLRLSTLTHQRQRLLDIGAPSRPVGDVAETALGKMLDAKRSNGTPTPYLRNINVRWGAVDVSDIQTVPLSEDERTRFALERGDLLVCEGGEPGRCAIWADSDDLMTFQKALHRVRVRDHGTTDIRYVALMLEEFIKSGRADSMYTGTTIRHLPQEKLRLITIPVPTMEMQLDVIDAMDRLTSTVEVASQQANTVVRRAALLRRSLLAAAFSGKLTGSQFPAACEVFARV